MPTNRQTNMLFRMETHEETARRAVRLGEILGIRVIPVMQNSDKRDGAVLAAQGRGERVVAWGHTDGAVSVLIPSLKNPYEMDRIVIEKAVEQGGLRTLFDEGGWEFIRKEAYIGIPQEDRWRYVQEGDILSAGERFIREKIREFSRELRRDAPSTGLTPGLGKEAVNRVAVWMRMAKMMNPALAAATVLSAVAFNCAVVKGAERGERRVAAPTLMQRSGIGNTLAGLLRRMDGSEKATEAMVAEKPLVLSVGRGPAVLTGLLPALPFSVKPEVLNRGVVGSGRDPGFDPLLLSQLPDMLLNPVAIFRPVPGTEDRGRVTMVLPVLDFASPDRLLVVNVRPVGTVGVNAITSVYTKEAKDILGWVNAQDRMAWCRKEFSTFLGKTVGYAIGKLAESIEMYGQLIGAGENKPRTEQLSNTTDLSARLGQTVSGKVELAGELLSATKVINSFVNATVQEGKTFVIAKKAPEVVVHTERRQSGKGHDAGRKQPSSPAYRSPEEYKAWRDGLVQKDREKATRASQFRPGGEGQKTGTPGGTKIK